MDIPKEFFPVLLVQIALFLGLWMLLKRLWFDPALTVIAEREKRSHGSVAEAKRLQDEAERLRREHGAAIDQAKNEAQRDVQELLRQTDTAQRALIDEATSEAQRIASEMRERMTTEVAAARKDLQAEIHVIAHEVAKATLGRAV